MIEGSIIMPTTAKGARRKIRKQAVSRHQERAKIEKSIDAYYSSLSDKEEAEQSEWGDFATNEFLRES